MNNINVVPVGLNPINLNIVQVCSNLTGDSASNHSASSISTALNPAFTNFREVTLFWLKFGYKVIPVFPGTKKTTVKWDPWLEKHSDLAIKKYWRQHPDHELGFIAGDEFIVLDADSPESIAALAEIEKAFDVRSNLVVKTKKGVHHHFKRAKGTVAKSDAHCTEKFPARIDVKTGRALVILPPSTGKHIALNEAENANDLTEVGQDFIDAISRHNGRNVSNVSKQAPSVTYTIKTPSKILIWLKALLPYIDSSSYDDWLRVLMVICNETGGSDDGFDLANSWSSYGSKYEGEKDIRTKWNSFNLNHPNPVKFGTICKMVDDSGYDWMTICADAEDQFEAIDDAAEGSK
ncbi:MAG TPA: PriCT-2 domain-containing protein [Methylotenera sp.]|nr:PriCT-2 domain-containing protein [Methylotenera sp.]HPH06767.1 PriCT-2 domain-containing protein [Methylotenera sp.]HPM49862.1 PriCT-2 domain-containing protein [Methylotenera sp.]